MNEVASFVLAALSSLLGVSIFPAEPGHWVYESQWRRDGNSWVTSATSQTIARECNSTRDGYLAFPTVIHGAHKIYADGKLVMQFGDPTFQTTRSFYGSPVFACHFVPSDTAVLRWEVWSYSSYFARIPKSPTFQASSPKANVFSETFHTLGFGGAIVIGLFVFTVFAGKVAPPLLYSLLGGCLGLAIYFAGSVIGLFGIAVPMLTAHRIADLGVWTGMFSIMNSLRLEGLLGRRGLLLYSANVLLGVGLITFGLSGDVIQLGTCIPFVPTIILFLILIGRIFQEVSKRRTKNFFRFRSRDLLRVMSLSLFVLTGLNEIAVVSGLLDSYPLLPIGFVSGLFFFALSVHDRIDATYRERDFLRSNLEAEVERKTEELRNRSDELQTAMTQLKSTQAELVQNAKLASLGTLSAGIAHEINNSLNYVNGALKPLEQIALRSAQDADRTKVEKLTGVMREGLELTFEIIRSLKTHAGLNQAKNNDVSLRKTADTSLALLRSKWRGKVDVKNDIPETAVIFGSVIGINQIFTNLIGNAIDAMPTGGTLILSAPVMDDKEVTICVSDTGMGMSEEVRTRIFEPFFTTKGVGEGTGLGLHIVRTEVDRHNGRIQVESSVGHGTTIRLRFPVKGVDESSPTVASTIPTPRSEAA